MPNTWISGVIRRRKDSVAFIKRMARASRANCQLWCGVLLEWLEFVGNAAGEEALPGTFTFQWELAIVQVSNWFSSETLGAAKVLEESQPVTGASSSSGVFTAKCVTMYCVSPQGPTDCGSNDISKQTSLTIGQNSLRCHLLFLSLTPASTGVLLYTVSTLWDSIAD